MSTNQTNGVAGGPPPAPPRVSVGEFFRQVRQEANKVSWPSRKETLVTTGMVFAMSILAAVFFFLVDWVVSHAVKLVLGAGG
ncbi:MAG: preprotein translocase subunit SecE [Alphaproteobacteria bacterium]|nr:preprotein translocase subunit SecE [Alphaproteobacteria bacterium]